MRSAAMFWLEITKYIGPWSRCKKVTLIQGDLVAVLTRK